MGARVPALQGADTCAIMHYVITYDQREVIYYSQRFIIS